MGFKGIGRKAGIGKIMDGWLSTTTNGRAQPQLYSMLSAPGYPSSRCSPAELDSVSPGKFLLPFYKLQSKVRKLLSQENVRYKRVLVMSKVTHTKWKRGISINGDSNLPTIFSPISTNILFCDSDVRLGSCRIGKGKKMKKVEFFP